MFLGKGKALTQEFIKDYILSLTTKLKSINPSKIEEVIKKLDEIEKNRAKVYVIGNGGSSATASHMVNDLGVGLARRDIKSLSIENLSDNSSVITALANDVGYENIFYYQLKNKITSNDLIIAISCSGNSENIIKTVKYAKENSVTVVSFTGFDGGKLKELSDINLHIDSKKGEYGLVEDMHMIFNHIIYSYYIKKGKSSE